MPDSAAIMKTLLEALPDEADARDELVAVGGVASAIINATAPEGRADLVECFCDTLRKSVAVELN